MSAVETAQTLPEEPSDLESLAPATEHELREAGLRVASGKGRFGGMFSSDEDSSDEEGGFRSRGEGDGDGVGEGEGKFGLGRRPSTTEAKERRPLDDGDDVEELGGGSGGGAGGGKGSSSEDEELLVEIKPRRKS